MTSVEQFAADVTELYSRATRAVFAISGDWHLSEESAQEALTRAWEQVDRGKELDSLEAWVMRVAFNWCRSQLRRDGAEDRALQRLKTLDPPPSSNSAAAVLATQVIGEDVRQAVLRLPNRQREVIVLHYLLDMDIASIADVVQRSEGAVKNALFNARSTLVRLLGESGGATATSGSELGGRR